MQLSSLLEAKLVFIDETSVTKEEVITSMVGRICSFYKQITQFEIIHAKVMDREKQESTVYPSGIAVPHIWMEGLDDTIICICIPRKQIVENGIDIRLFVFVISDVDSSKLYLKIVSRILLLSQNKEVMDRLCSEKDGAGVYQLISESDIRVIQELTVKDIMVTDPIVVRDTALLKELGNLFEKHRLYFIPVVDKNDHYVGEVTIMQYLKVGVPDYLLMMENLNFLRSFKAFEHLHEREEQIMVKDIMEKSDVFTYPTSSIIKVVFKMIQHQKRILTVIDRKKVVGIVSTSDVFTKAVRA